MTVRKYKGTILIDVREFYLTPDGELKPGKKGISLTVAEWNVLNRSTTISEVDDVINAFKSDDN